MDPKQKHASGKAQQGHRHPYLLVFYDFCLLLAVNFMILVLHPSSVSRLPWTSILTHLLLNAACIFGCRFLGRMYKQVWRYCSSAVYIQLCLWDFLAGWLYFLLTLLLPVERITFVRTVAIVALNLLLTLSIRLVYQYLYDFSSEKSRIARLIRHLLARFMGLRIETSPVAGIQTSKNNIAILGAGRVGVSLANELIQNRSAAYAPVLFIDKDKEKIGRRINGIPVFPEEEVNAELLSRYQVQELVFAISDLSGEKIRALYDRYKNIGYKLRVYDYPVTPTAPDCKRQLREFGIEELLFRRPLRFTDEHTSAYYHGKTVLISGGGGSIGSELCRQIAHMNPRKLVILDVYENGAYDIQQELRIARQNTLELAVEICSVCDAEALDRVFACHKPEIVLHAAAHKHVPLMEHNCCEAVRNNVFGTLNIVEISEKYCVEKFIMISTDKAVNPTNVMGATKRMCEMIVQSRKNSATCFSATRFGNVLGSNGSVIPLFKRQIMNGGPVTITDKRIIRYFMTIPEASQLVLQSGAMARSGELYVLDMGKPVKILELAENMIRLSGLEPYKDIDIIETGLRPGEKLYEELLVKTGELNKTGNDMIFVERSQPQDAASISRKLQILRQAVDSGDDEQAKAALKRVVRTYRAPEMVNAGAILAEEMRMAEPEDSIA